MEKVREGGREDISGRAKGGGERCCSAFCSTVRQFALVARTIYLWITLTPHHCLL